MHREEPEVHVSQRTAQLQAANEELESFSNSALNDLRAPLRHLDGFSGILLDEYADRLDEKGRHCLEKLRSGSRRMEQLINDLLLVSRVARCDFVPVQLDQRALARETAVENLVSNAWKFTRFRRPACIKM